MVRKIFQESFKFDFRMIVFAVFIIAFAKPHSRIGPRRIQIQYLHKFSHRMFMESIVIIAKSLHEVSVDE